MSAAEWFLVGLKAGDTRGPVSFVLSFVRLLGRVLGLIVVAGFLLALVGGTFLSWLGYEAYRWGHPWVDFTNPYRPLGFHGGLRWDVALVAVFAATAILFFVLAGAVSFGRQGPQMIIAWLLLAGSLGGYYLASAKMHPGSGDCTPGLTVAPTATMCESTTVAHVVDGDTLNVRDR